MTLWYEEEDVSHNWIFIITYAGLALICITCAALASGLTIGLLSLDTLKLKIKLIVGTPEEQTAAKSILPVIENHHLLLCTLLLFNAISNEALPIFLDAIVPSWCAVLVSVTLVLIFGEVIPAALFTGPNQLQIAARWTPLVYILKVLFYPIAFPIAKLLDHLLGTEDDDDAFNRREIGAMMQIIREERSYTVGTIKDGDTDFKFNNNNPNTNFSRRPSIAASDVSDCAVLTARQMLNGGYHSHHGSVASAHNSGKMTGSGSYGFSGMFNSGGGGDRYRSNTNVAYSPIAEENDTELVEEGELSSVEMSVISGVISLASLTVADVYIPLEKANMLSSSQIIDKDVIDVIYETGNSRLPVFRGENVHDVIGFLLVKRLMKVNPEVATPLSTLPLNEPVVIGAKSLLIDVMKIFQSGYTHLAIVSKDPVQLRQTIREGLPPLPGSEPIGILTIEDILEKMLQANITDETDAHDNGDNDNNNGGDDGDGSTASRHKASLRLREISLSAASLHASKVSDDNDNTSVTGNNNNDDMIIVRKSNHNQKFATTPKSLTISNNNSHNNNSITYLANERTPQLIQGMINNYNHSTTGQHTGQLYNPYGNSSTAAFNYSKARFPRRTTPDLESNLEAPLLSNDQYSESDNNSTHNDYDYNDNNGGNNTYKSRRSSKASSVYSLNLTAVEGNTVAGQQRVVRSIQISNDEANAILSSRSVNGAPSEKALNKRPTPGRLAKYIKKKISDTASSVVHATNLTSSDKKQTQSSSSSVQTQGAVVGTTAATTSGSGSGGVSTSSPTSRRSTLMSGIAANVATDAATTGGNGNNVTTSDNNNTEGEIVIAPRSWSVADMFKKKQISASSHSLSQKDIEATGADATGAAATSPLKEKPARRTSTLMMGLGSAIGNNNSGDLSNKNTTNNNTNNISDGNNNTEGVGEINAFRSWSVADMFKKKSRTSSLLSENLGSDKKETTAVVTSALADDAESGGGASSISVAATTLAGQNTEGTVNDDTAGK